MSFEEAFESAVAEIADGLSVDWAELQRLADTSARRNLVDQLRILGGVGATHGSRDEGAPSPGDPSAETAPAIYEGGPPPGPMWGRYELRRQLGEGGYAFVYLGRDGDLHREVAIKLFRRTVAARVKEEGRILAKVKHDHVVEIYDVAEHDGRFGLCMEFIDGRTLDDIVRIDGPMSAEQAAIDGQSICKALAAVHTKGVLHRDVKARNVMRERGGRIVLMDLGAGIVAERVAEGRRPQNIGTPLFMAPELIDDSSSASERTDIYSLGVLLYYLVTGRYPVEGKTIELIRENHKAGRRVPLDERRPSLSPFYVRLVERATAPAPADRYESAVALLRDLNRIVTPDPPPEPVAVPVPAPAPPPVPWTTKDWARVAGTTIGAALVLAELSGLLTTWTFNTVIDRPAPFDSDSLLMAWRVGLQSLVVPIVVTGVSLGVLGLIAVVTRLLGLGSKAIRGIEGLLRGRVPEHEYASVMAHVTALAGLLAIAIVVTGFGDVILSFVSSLSTAPFEVFAPLQSPPPRENAQRRVLYRATVAALLLIVILGWKNVQQVRLRFGGVVPLWLSAASVILAGALFVLLQAPYKLFASDQNQMPVVLIDGARCYLLGTAGDDVRTYCPDAALPRVRTMRRAGSKIEPCGFEENVFSRPSAHNCSRSQPAGGTP